MKVSLTVLILTLGLGACGGGSSESSSSGTTTTAATSSDASPGDACLATMARERECQDAFVPALVALRVRVDMPAGIAAEDASGGRDALVTSARAEYAAGATDEAFQQNCAQMAQMPAEQASAWTDIMEGCLATTDCAAFVECDIRFTETRLTGH